jgi:hypothetical protein
MYSKGLEAGKLGVCLGIAVTGSELPTELIGRYGLERRLYVRVEQREYRFLYRDRRPCLPIWGDGQLQVVRWGNGRGQSRFLPRTGWTWQESVREGRCRDSGAIPVDIPANYGLDLGKLHKIRIWPVITTPQI